jgi:hypothetical protein
VACEGHDEPRWDARAEVLCSEVLGSNMLGGHGLGGAVLSMLGTQSSPCSTSPTGHSGTPVQRSSSAERVSPGQGH